MKHRGAEHGSSGTRLVDALGLLTNNAVLTQCFWTVLAAQRRGREAMLRGGNPFALIVAQSATPDDVTRAKRTILMAVKYQGRR